MELREGTVVADRFRLVRMIGRGGMGSVWQALHLGLDIPCAVKFIEGELANVADAHARFEREAKAAAQLRSPHVVQIIDHGVWQGHPYIAMELLDGEDLGKALAKAGGKLPPASVDTMVQQVCRALAKAHAAGIVHRDLKPDNIFLVNDDDRQIVKILDFGVAKHTSQTIDGSNTKTGAMLGTPYYMSPEQAQGIKGVDGRSDLWSLAVIVYQCLTGRLPFESEALGDLLVKIIVQPVPVPSTVAPVPVGFDRWWAKAAERAPENRFQTAKEFASSLALALGNSAVTDTGHHSNPAFKGTALMGQGVNSNVTPMHSTPNPYPPPSPPYPGNPTPQVMVMGQPPMLGGSGNPVTFPGAESTLRKKSVPIGLLVFVVVAIVGVGIGGVALLRRSAGAPSGAHSSVSATASPSPVESAIPSAAVSAPLPSKSASAPLLAATASDVPPTPAPVTSAAPSKMGGSAAPTGKTPTLHPSAKATTSAPASPTPSAKTKWDLGF